MMLVKEVLDQQKTIAGSFMIKKAYSVQMSYEISDPEKKEAEQALLYFNAALRLLDQADDHLNLMKTPFKDNPEIPPQDVMKARAAIRRFRDQAIDNFNKFKQAGFKCVSVMQGFSSDTQTVKLMKSFISAVEELETSVNQFADLFEDLQSKDFAKNVVTAI